MRTAHQPQICPPNFFNGPRLGVLVQRCLSLMICDAWVCLCIQQDLQNTSVSIATPRHKDTHQPRSPWSILSINHHQSSGSIILGHSTNQKIIRIIFLGMTWLIHVPTTGTIQRIHLDLTKVRKDQGSGGRDISTIHLRLLWTMAAVNNQNQYG